MLTRFKFWKRAQKVKKRKQLTPLTRWEEDQLLKLFSTEEFSLFLKFLDLTVENKLYILSSMNLLDQKELHEAIKLQYQMAGINSVQYIVEGLLADAKEAGEDERLTQTKADEEEAAMKERID